MSVSTTECWTAVQHAATRLGLPAAWLRREIDAGRVPGLRVGRRVLVNVATVAAALARRAEHQDGARGDQEGTGGRHRGDA